MQNYISWQDGPMSLGYPEEYPDYWKQGETMDALKENLMRELKDPGCVFFRHGRRLIDPLE
jgi:hypothetical protein